MNPTSSLRISRPGAALLIAAAALLIYQVTAPRADAETAAASPLPVSASLTLHGSTPTMSWSPDSSRITTNSAQDYLQEGAPKGAGVYVLDAKGGKTIQLTTEQGYHPLWLGSQTIVWGHSPYEDGTPGLFTSPASRSRPKRLGKYEGVYHTLPAKDGRILFFSGWPESQNWQYADPKTGNLSEAPVKPPPGQEWFDSWEKPRDLILDQCPSQVGDVSATVEEGRYIVEISGRRVVLPDAPYIYTYKDPAPVAPCVSPDGQFVSYFTTTNTDGDYDLRVVKVR